MPIPTASGLVVPLTKTVNAGVIYLDVDAAGIDHTVACIRQFFAERSAKGAKGQGASGVY